MYFTLTDFKQSKYLSTNRIRIKIKNIFQINIMEIFLKLIYIY